MDAGLLLGLAIVSGLPLATGAAQTVEEYQLKAAFLYNLAKFVEWPPEVYGSPMDPLVICILGENPFGEALEQAVHGKTVEGRRVAVRPVAEARQVKGCQILFVSSSERKRVRPILADIQTSGILTVGDTDGFPAEGGVVDLKLEGGRIRIEVNVEAALRERLRISSRLLSLAQIVKK